MTLWVLGVNHRTASVGVRERVAFLPQSMTLALQAACDVPGICEMAILSTCNRTELYCVTDTASTRIVRDWLARYQGLDAALMRDIFYEFRDERAVAHMMRVASGLDSMVLGEPQILGQMKDTYAQARQSGTLGSELGRLFEQVFAVAKRVRTETAIGENPVSVAYAAVSMARHIFSDMRETRALLIGAGSTIELVARHLREIGVRQIIVANRTLTRGQALADTLGAQAIVLGDIPLHLHTADIVIASTASQLPILGKGAVEQALRQRKHRPMFMVDIAVPRDIEPEVGRLNDVYLYTVDDLKQVIEENIKSREGAAREAEHLVESGAADYMRQLKALESVSTLRQFRDTAEQWRDLELEKALRALRRGNDPEAVLRMMARGLTNKLLHAPTVQVRKASAEGRSEATDWLRELFMLDSETPCNDASSSTDSVNGDDPESTSVVVPFLSRARD